MRKCFLIGLILIVGCASQKDYIIPPGFAERMNSLGAQVNKCISPSKYMPYYISPAKEPNAWVDGEKIVFTEGVFIFDDNTLKFIMAHEIAHEKLGHIAKVKTVGYLTTAGMMVLNFIIPGSGLLNYAVHPAVVNNFNKPQELEADRLASEACECMGISKERQIEILNGMKARMQEGGSFWAAHPSWEDRIKNISAPQ